MIPTYSQDISEMESAMPRMRLMPLNKWLKKDFDGLTAHCLRHTFRDRLRAVECPMDLIDQIGGWKSVSSIGNSYGLGYSVKQIRKLMQLVNIF